MQAKQYALFDDMTSAISAKKKARTYEEFVDKFQTKKTTDDCYTPEPVYNVVLDWVRRNCDIEGCRIVRPFYPGGDYQAEEYGANDVVVDNPPFSIITKIVRFYVEHGVRFFLFAPYLTLFRSGHMCTSVVCNATVVYENGAKVNTSFVTNMLGDVCAMTAPDLLADIEEAQKTYSKELPQYIYPKHVIRATDMGYLVRNGVWFSFAKDQAVFQTKLDLQGNTSIFGGGYLVSDKVALNRRAADRAAAEKAVEDRVAADRAAAQEAIVWELSDRELGIVKNLSEKDVI